MAAHARTETAEEEEGMNYPSLFVGMVSAYPGSRTRLIMCYAIFRDLTGALVNSQWFSQEMWEGLAWSADT